MSAECSIVRRLKLALTQVSARAACGTPDTAATFVQKLFLLFAPAATTRLPCTPGVLAAAGAILFSTALAAPTSLSAASSAPQAARDLRAPVEPPVTPPAASIENRESKIENPPAAASADSIRNPQSTIRHPTDAPTSVVIPAGAYTPLLRSSRDPEKIPVAAFRLAVTPVTNAEFLAFVRANPKWQRSRVSPLFADRSYLEHWAGDLELGPRAPAGAPVVRVSWFAARAYAAWTGARLPTTAEWELAARAGYASADGRNDEQLNRDLYAWLARPVPAVLPEVATAKANFHGARGLHGLVWEWVSDFNTAMVTGESRADSGLERDLFCGAGSAGAKDTGDYAAFMRGALRSSLKANNTTTSLGFRCAQDLAP